MENNKKNTSKSTNNPMRWIVGYLLIILIGVAAYIYVDYRINPLQYYTSYGSGEDNFLSSEYARAIKLNYLYDHHEDYDAVIFGGSKAGSVDTTLLTEYSGQRYYNLHANCGNFADYLRYTEFIVNSCPNIKEIMICLSSFETIKYDRSNDGTVLGVPAIVSGSETKRAAEFVKFLVSDMATLRRSLHMAKSLENYGLKEGELLKDGVRMRTRLLVKELVDPVPYADRILASTESDLKSFFNLGCETSQAKNRQSNIEAMRQIKTLCDQNGVTLKLVFGASFVNERSRFECPSYYNYMTELVNIVGEAWDFSDYNSVNMNPYNFANKTHYSLATGDEMIRTMYGEGTVDDFGVYLTPDKMPDYTAKRQADFNHYKEVFETTGTLPYGTMEDTGYLPFESAHYYQGEILETAQIAADELKAQKEALELETEDPDEEA
ncbi:MAG: hypothetical protein Q4B59_04400 [Lachnospiraceae bacterium]|nr:hypothetical protein [Lachnospiraceae bacterium]